MRNYKEIGLIILAALFLASCGSTGGSQTIYSPGSTSTSESERQAILEQQRVLAEERALVREQAESQPVTAADAVEETRQEILEAERIAEASRLAQQEQERAQREAEESARQEAERQRELASRRAQEQARIVAAQQARVDELSAQIAANANETENLEAANAVLRQAVAAAEQLTDALAAEEVKYNNTDPVSGEPLESLDSERLDQLADDVSSLSSQAESLLSQP
jgi:fused signal recognition particle receptor